MSEHNNDEVWKYAEKSLTWSGWGSPIGLGLFVVALAVAVLLCRYAWVLR